MVTIILYLTHRHILVAHGNDGCAATFFFVVEEKYCSLSDLFIIMLFLCNGIDEGWQRIYVRSPDFIESIGHSHTMKKKKKTSHNSELQNLARYKAWTEK